MSLHGDLMTPAEPETTTVQGALGNGERPRAEGDLPSLRGRQRDAHEQLRRVQHRQGAEVRVHLRADAGRVPAPDPGLPRCLVRRLQRHLHADASDERQVLHRGGLLGWRRVVQGRRQGRGRRAVPVQRPRRRRRVHVPGRPQRARDGGDHRAGAGAPGRARAHEQRARHHVPDHQHRHDGLRRRRQPGLGRSLRSRDAELVPHDEEGARRVAGRPEAVRVRVHGGHAEPQRSVPVAGQRRRRRDTPSR